jgi:methionyl-tRNA formyltransferase
MKDNRRIVLIGADTARARAYASAIERAGMGPIEGIFYGTPAATLQAGPDEGRQVGDLWLPHIATGVAEIFERNGWSSKWLAAEKINDRICIDALRASGATLAIFAGRGGEIVSAETLSQGVPVLHMHPGKLPEQRGSTTIFYSLLEGKPCSVSALLMDKEIDAGPIVAINSYPAPHRGMDVDVLYDCAIRADTLVAVLRQLASTGRLPRVTPDAASDNGLYYVVHPLLKHLALLSLHDAPGIAAETEQGCPVTQSDEGQHA